MRRSAPRFVLVVTLVAAAAVALPARTVAQSTTPAAMPEPPRPRLAADADTNDAEPYLTLARGRLVRRDWKQAAAAAYWATRLDPTSAPALLVRGMAESQATDWKRLGSRAPEEKLRVDSIFLRALLRDPFANSDESLVSRFGVPLSAVRAEIQRHPDAIGLRYYLATRYFAHQHFDSTVAELRAALGVLERLDRDHPPAVYQSREILHYAIAKALFAAGERNEARNEYAAALGENVAFYPAHAELGTIAWTQWNDIEKAREEFALALELHDDALVHYDYGTVLLLARQPGEAVAQFDRAIALEPSFANAYANRAIALDRLGRRDEARAAYEAFVARAPRRLAPTVATARERARVLAAPPAADSSTVSRPPSGP